MSSTDEDHIAISMVAPPESPLKRATESLVKSRLESIFDKDLVQQAIEDAGRWAYGTLLVELWVLTDDKTKLYRPEGGAWLDPVCHVHHETCPLCRLTNPSFEGFVGPEPLSPGVGLPGVLWNEASNAASNHQSTMNVTRTMNLGPMSKSLMNFQRKVVWRDVNSLVVDPDQQTNPRLEVIAEAGLGWAAAVPFDIGGKQGIVLYMARKGVNKRKLQSNSNEAYLTASADLIGSAFALRRPRRSVILERTQEHSSARIRARNKLLALLHTGVTLADLAQAPEMFKSQHEQQAEPWTKERNAVGKACAFLKYKAVATTKKSIMGGGNQPPPPFNIYQTLWTFQGVFLTLLALTNLNTHMVETYGSDYRIVLGPFGALMTLQYGLTAAPASQPRNAILGQVIALTISLLISMADSSLELYMRQSLATALAVACMVKFGITHPPAGAAALLFASGTLKWSHMLMILVGDVIAIGMAMIWNNLHDKRQYPTYFGFTLIVRVLQRSDDKRKD